MNERNYKITLFARLGSINPYPDKAQLKRSAAGMARVLNEHLNDMDHPSAFDEDRATMEEIVE